LFEEEERAENLTGKKNSATWQRRAHASGSGPFLLSLLPAAASTTLASALCPLEQRQRRRTVSRVANAIL
jgi:hypothetical protein